MDFRISVLGHCLLFVILIIQLRSNKANLLSGLLKPGPLGPDLYIAGEIPRHKTELMETGINVVQAAERPNVRYAFLDIEKEGGGVFLN